MIIYLRYYKLTPKGEANQSGSCFCFLSWQGCKFKKAIWQKGAKY